jgi:hypothetical protein
MSLLRINCSIAETIFSMRCVDCDWTADWLEMHGRVLVLDPPSPAFTSSRTLAGDSSSCPELALRMECIRLTVPCCQDPAMRAAS